TKRIYRNPSTSDRVIPGLSLLKPSSEKEKTQNTTVTTTISPSPTTPHHSNHRLTIRVAIRATPLPSKFGLLIFVFVLNSFKHASAIGEVDNCNLNGLPPPRHPLPNTIPA